MHASPKTEPYDSHDLFLILPECSCSQGLIFFVFRTRPWGGWDKGVHLLQCQLGAGEDQPEWCGALRGGEGQEAPLLRLLEKQLRLHRAGEEGLLVRWLQLLWQVIAQLVYLNSGLIDPPSVKARDFLHRGKEGESNLIGKSIPCNYFCC